MFNLNVWIFKTSFKFIYSWKGAKIAPLLNDFVFKYDEWFKLLTRKKKYNYKKNKGNNKGNNKVIIKNKLNISERPQEANQRLKFGHFEADTIFSCSGSKSALLVLVDRLTRKTHTKNWKGKQLP